MKPNMQYWEQVQHPLGLEAYIHRQLPLKAIQSYNMNNDGMHHVSVSLDTRLPTLTEIALVKHDFFEEWEVVTQEKAKGLNPFVIHLKSPLTKPIA